MRYFVYTINKNVENSDSVKIDLLPPFENFNSSRTDYEIIAKYVNGIWQFLNWKFHQVGSWQPAYAGEARQSFGMTLDGVVRDID